jgi:acetyltransferase
VTNLDRKSCEFALVVSDRWQRIGIAHHLMQKLIQAARDRGLETMIGEVLANNVRMLELMKSLNFETKKHPDDMSIIQVEYRLD